MISYISGIVQKISFLKDCYIDILTKVGIGYRVYIPKTFRMVEEGKEVSVYTYFHVREDRQMLFGFEKEMDRDFFETLLSVSGVGPKTALAVLSTYSREEIEKIVAGGDSAKLSKVSGLGSKGAQKIILELRGKIDFKDKEDKDNLVLIDVKEALKSLGFNGTDLNEKIEYSKKVQKKQKDITPEELIKKVLSR
jgi:holliday junction DNA helicase RuvA